VAAALVAGLAVGAAITGWYEAKPKVPGEAVAAPAPAAARGEPEEDVLDDETLAELAAAEEAPVPDKNAAATPAAPAEPLLNSLQQQRMAGYATGGQRLLAERIAATRAVLEQADDGRYALELFVTDNVDPARMERFLLRARDMVPLSDVYVIPVLAGAGRYRLRVVYGNYASAADAKAASEHLPPKYQREFHISAHSFEDLRGQL
jgi:hypothetical protein